MLADLLRPQGAAAPISTQMPLLAEAVVLQVVDGGLLVALLEDDGPSEQSYGPVRWVPPAVHTHPAGAGFAGAQTNPDPTDKECLVAFVDGDPGRGWVLTVAW